MPYDQKQVVEALRAFERGEIVVVMDDDDRENEGDLIVAAVHCTPEKMAFIVRHTSGIVCTPMPREEAKRLNLTPMVADNDSAHTTAFTVTVDFKHGTTTGISADDRTLTVRNLANRNVGASDFVRPGHIFPLIAREGGVLMRSAIPKRPSISASSPACRRSASSPNWSTTTAPSCAARRWRPLPRSNGLKQVSVADLIAYRQRKETLIERVASFDIETPGGKAKAYHLHAALGPDAASGRRLRRHPRRRGRAGAAAFGECRRPMSSAPATSSTTIMKTMGERKRGVIVYLREGSVGVAPPGAQRGRLPQRPRGP